MRLRGKSQHTRIGPLVKIRHTRSQSARKGKKGAPLSDAEQADAAMKALHGKSVGDIGNMSQKERDAFFKDMEKKYAK